MALYLVNGYLGTGTSADPFSPTLVPGWSAVMLTPGSADAQALLWLPPGSPDTDKRLTKLADSKTEPLVASSRSAVDSALGVVTDSRSATARDLVTDLLLNAPGSKWNRVKPTAGRYEIWLGGEDWGFMPQSVGASYNTTFAGSENPLSEGGAWVSGDGDWLDVQKISGVANPSVAGSFLDCGARMVSATVGADQYSEGPIVMTVGANRYTCGCAVRMASGADESCYLADGIMDAGSGVSRIFKVNASFGFTNIAEVNPSAWATGNVLRCEARGSTIRMYRDGTLVTSVTDSTIATGQPGLHLASSGVVGDAGFTDWIGSDVRQWILGTH